LWAAPAMASLLMGLRVGAQARGSRGVLQRRMICEAVISEPARKKPGSLRARAEST
jgi:hypothetical protein